MSKVIKEIEGKEEEIDSDNLFEIKKKEVTSAKGEVFYKNKKLYGDIFYEIFKKNYKEETDEWVIVGFFSMNFIFDGITFKFFNDIVEAIEANKKDFIYKGFPKIYVPGFTIEIDKNPNTNFLSTFFFEQLSEITNKVKQIVPYEDQVDYNPKEIKYELIPVSKVKQEKKIDKPKKSKAISDDIKAKLKDMIPLEIWEKYEYIRASNLGFSIDSWIKANKCENISKLAILMKSKIDLDTSKLKNTTAKGMEDFVKEYSEEIEKEYDKLYAKNKKNHSLTNKELKDKVKELIPDETWKKIYEINETKKSPFISSELENNLKNEDFVSKIKDKFSIEIPDLIGKSDEFIKDYVKKYTLYIDAEYKKFKETKGFNYNHSNLSFTISPSFFKNPDGSEVKLSM